ncbi:MAG: serine/threonine protein kinase [Myxococcales bacterium]|nr:serine/threonine protein kinase [Myxococcales bacterium]
MATLRFPVGFGKYTLLGPLSPGGEGRVFLASSGPGARPCVLKKVAGVAPTALAVRFRDETRALAGLDHPNLARTFDAGQVYGELYLVGELVEGRDLGALSARLAERGRRLPVPLALRIVREICRGLAHAHGLGILHRNLAPSNVLLSWSGEVKLTDFALGALPGRREHVAWMSPEEALGQEGDAGADLWAVGVMLWELLAGRALHDPALDRTSLLADVRAARIPSLTVAGVSRALEATLLRALAVERGGRWSSAEVLGDAIGREAAALAPVAAPANSSAPDGAALVALLRDLWGAEIDRERAELERMRKGGPRREGPTETRGPRPGPPPIDEPPMVVDPPRPGKTDPSPAPEFAEEEVEPDADAYIGQVVDGRYRVERVLGVGGMGWVYEVEHIELRKKLALKVLLPRYSREADLVQRFRSEARAASTIGHPNIVDVTDSGTTRDGSFFFVMERLDGVELGNALHAERRLAPERAVHIAIQLCRGLAAAHAVGIIHRDLKPENVYLTSRDGDADFVKILDFGIAKSRDEAALNLSSPGVAMGTPEYMAPEQAAGRPIDTRIDIYAVGAILYEMVTGKPPHSGDNVLDILTRKASEAPRPVRALNPDVPEAIERVIHACLEIDPDRRPPTMGALEYELTKSVRGRGTAVAALLGIKAGDGDQSWSAGLPGIRGLPTTAAERIAMAAHDPSTRSLDLVRREATSPSPATGELELVTPTAAAEPLALIHGEIPGQGKLRRRLLVAGAVAAGLLIAGGVAVALWPEPEKGPPKWTDVRSPERPSLPLLSPASSAGPPPSEGNRQEGKREDVASLLEWARRAADGGRLIAPPGDNLKELLDRIAAVEPGSVPAAALRARLTATLRTRAGDEAKRGKLDEAVADYRALWEIDPTDSPAQARLALTLAARATRAAARKQPAAALADAAAAADLDPENPKVHSAFGDALLANGERERAALEYRKVLAVNPRDGRAKKQLAAALRPEMKKSPR